jgi:hypothetical protein
MRICKKCEIEKDITEYYLKKNGKVRSSYCKVCYNIVYKTEYDNANILKHCKRLIA